MSVTIDSLDIQIKTSAGQAEKNIDALATSLGKLKENSNLTKVTNNLNKLATSLAALNKSASGLNNLDKISSALNGLSGVQKLSGLNSALNTLKKLPDIVNSLDSTTLATFTTRMEKLATAMAPLATQINTVGAGFAKLPSKLTSAVSATNKLTVSQQKLCDELNVTSINLMANISNLDAFIGVARQFMTTMSQVLSQAIEWDGIQFRFGRAFGEDAEETYAYIQKINEALGINIQEFMQYSSLYGSLLSGFGMAQEKVTAISVGLTELSYDIWAAYNDRFKTLEDASEAVRSAITGEIEPIRNAGIALTEASLQEFIDSTHLAGVSIEKLTEAQKAEVRYAAMVEAAMNQGIVGTYAKEMHTAEGAVRSLSQSLKTLVQAFGSLFIPILQIVVPYVTAFVEILTDAVRVVANFFGIELFKIDWSSTSKGVGGLADGATDTATGLGKAAKEAKKLKDYTMGFDELNVISPDTGSSGSGGSGGGAGTDNGWGSGLDLDSLWDDSIFDQASKKVDEIKAKILKFAEDWKWVFAVAGVALTGLVANKAWGTLAVLATSAIAPYINLYNWGSKVVNVMTALAVAAKGPQTLFDALKGGNAASSALTFMFPKLTAIATAISSAASAVGTFIAGISAPVWGIIAAVIAGIASTAYFLYENWDKVTKAAKDFFNENIAPKLEEIGKHWENMKSALSGVAKAILDAIPPGVKSMLVSFAEWVRDIVAAIGEWFASVEWLKAIGTVFEVIGGVIFGVISGVIAGAFNMLVGIIENAIQIFSGVVQVVSGVIEFIVALFSGGDIGAAWDKIWTGVLDVIDGCVQLIFEPIIDIVEGVIDWFTELWDELVGHSIVPDTVNGIIEWFGKLPDKILGPLQDFINEIITKFKNMWSSIKSWYSSNVAPKFTKEYWSNTFDTLRSSLKTKLDEAWKAVKDFFSASEWKKKVDEAVKAIKDNFKMPSFPKISLGVVWETNVDGMRKAVYEALGLAGWPTLKWNAYATGGTPSMGEMFIAREAGPELVGRIGNRSAVVNNDQIVAAVSQGVYDAVRAASGGNGDGSQNINVYLDGKQIYASVKRVESHRGKNLMGNQLGYLY